jgi:hypothetical protein
MLAQRPKIAFGFLCFWIVVRYVVFDVCACGEGANKTDEMLMLKMSLVCSNEGRSNFPLGTPLAAPYMFVVRPACA